MFAKSVVLWGKSRDVRSCPHCGSYDLEGHLRDPWEQRGDIAAWIDCLGCDAQGPTGRTADEAAEKWNQRRGPTGDNACTREENERTEAEMNKSLHRTGELITLDGRSQFGFCVVRVGKVRGARKDGSIVREYRIVWSDNHMGTEFEAPEIEVDGVAIGRTPQCQVCKKCFIGMERVTIQGRGALFTCRDCMLAKRESSGMPGTGKV